MRILISAYACEPDKGSEPSIGWNCVNQIARFHEVWVITRANNRAAIENALARRPQPNIHWIYYDLPRWARFWKKEGRGIQLYYYLWQIGIYFVARDLLTRTSFDLVHHVTLVKYWAPSFLALLPLPFIWGPVGGGESTPGPFYTTFSLRGRLREHLRELARWLSEWDPFVRLTARRARIAFATTGETASRLKRIGARDVTLLPQVALSREEIDCLGTLPMREGNPFRVLSIGQLRSLKGFHLGLAAFARFQRSQPASEYWIIGDGPERQRLARLAQQLDIADKVTFLGVRSRAEVLSLLAEGDVLMHPTLHDSGGMVSLEAMAAGRPVICLDLGGPAHQVTPETGFKIPAISPQQVITDLSCALLELAQNPHMKQAMGKAARQRVGDEFTWEGKGEYLCRRYDAFM